MAISAPPQFESRHVPGPMAPAELVEVQDYLPTHVRIVARDSAGMTRIELVLEREDQASIRWLVKVLRHWLAWRHSAIMLRVMRRHG